MGSSSGLITIVVMTLLIIIIIIIMKSHISDICGLVPFRLPFPISDMMTMTIAEAINRFVSVERRGDIMLKSSPSVRPSVTDQTGEDQPDRMFDCLLASPRRAGYITFRVTQGSSSGSGWESH